MKSINVFNLKARELICALDSLSSNKMLSADFSGTHVEDGLLRNYEYMKYGEFFGQFSHRDNVKGDTLIIIGAINKNNLSELKKQYEKLSGPVKNVIYISGGLINKVLKSSYFTVKDLGRELPIDLEIKEFPINFSKLQEELMILEKKKQC